MMGLEPTAPTPKRVAAMMIARCLIPPLPPATETAAIIPPNDYAVNVPVGTRLG
jgi:hypothetical protein